MSFLLCTKKLITPCPSLFPVEAEFGGRHALVDLEPVEDVGEVALALLEQQVQGVLAFLKGRADTGWVSTSRNNASY